MRVRLTIGKVPSAKYCNVTISTLLLGIRYTQQLSKQISKLFFQMIFHVNSVKGRGWLFFLKEDWGISTVHGETSKTNSLL